MPVMLGAGVPLLPGPYATFGLKLASSRVLDSGLLMLTYQPAPAKSSGAKAKK